MDAPSGHKDLIADVEEDIRAKEAELNELRKRRGHDDDEVDEGYIDEDGRSVVATRPGGGGLVRETDWAYDTIEYQGEVFNVRKPQPQALTAFAIASGKYIPEDVQRDMISMFVYRHMSPQSFLRFNERMIDPDDPDFDASSMGELMRLISTVGTARPTGPSRR